MRATTALGLVSGSQPRTKKSSPSLLFNFASKVFILFSRCDLELAVFIAARFTRCLFYIVSLLGCPIKTFADQSLRDITDWRRFMITNCSGRSMVYEKK